jgi:LmbE family N-acetylglucosaminyl deacetylase
MAGRRYFRLMTILAAVFATIGVSLHTSSVASAASATCPNGSTMAVVAHEDDTLLFINPDILNDIQSGKCVQTVIMTAGDSGAGQSYWGMREQGTEAAYAEMAGVPNTWTQSDPGISGHPMQLMTLSGNPRVSLIFMQLPDGNFDGSGFPSTNNQSLQKLYTGSINQINAIDGSTSYTKPQLISTLTQLMQQFSPDKIYTQDFVGAYGDGDHSDHHTVAYLTRDASRAWTTATHTLIGYMDYASANQPANVSGNALTQKYNAYFAYAPYDGNVCQSVAACNQNGYGQWLQRQYTVGSEVDGPGSNNPPIANAGANQFVSPGSTVQLDGSGSYDPNGNPTYNWTQTAGPSVTLSSPTAVKPTFTAPSDSATLTFQLVVTDGQLSSQPSTVTVTVTPAGSNIAPQATVTASSQNTATGQLATKAVDGVIDGYPGDYTKEWATVGGGANSWLNLQWNNAFTVSKVILYDRPNLDDQITGATLKFSDGTVVQVPALNNDGSATVVTFPAVTTSSLLMTVTSVSSNTQNIGLAEIQVFPVSSANTGPSVTSTTPSSLAQGAANQNVTINGTGFLNGAVATFSNPGITVNSTTFNSATQLIANVSVAPGASTGPADVTVTNPDGSTTTASGAFTVNAAPTVTSTSPSALGQGTANQNVTINGTNFEPGATASFGAGITVNSTTFNSATQLTANITIAAGASLGARDVTVTNPDAGVGTGKGIFTVNAPR